VTAAKKMHQSSDAASVLNRGLYFLAVIHGLDNRLLRKIHNSQGGSAGQQIPVALGYHPWLFNRPPNAPDQRREKSPWIYKASLAPSAGS
jgi:hypothetical protein